MKLETTLPTSIEKGAMVSLDTEFFGQIKNKLHRPAGKFACLSFTLDGKTVYQIYDEADIPKTLSLLEPALWIFHNSLYDLRQLRRFAKIRPRPIWDTMLVEQSVYGGYYQTFSLSDLVRRRLNIRMNKAVREEFSDADAMSADMKKYAALDAALTFSVAIQQRAEFDDERLKPYWTVDEPMIFPLLDMPGICVDSEKWGEMADQFDAQGKGIETELGINVNSYKQVIQEARKFGVFLSDTKAESLKAYKGNMFISRVLEARMFRKASSTYGRKWLESNVETDGKVYGNYHITGTETGRMSASHPNMQQIPSRSLPQYRTLFTASPGNMMVVSDVMQQEPCILAHESKDPSLLEAIRSGEDLHLSVARAIFGDPKMPAEDPRRLIGKTINLGTAYGLSEFGLALRLNITEQDAAQFLRQYFNRFGGVFIWIQNQRAFVMRYGYAATATGRRIHINPHDNQWRNNAINAPIQGGAADMTKRWIRLLWERCSKEKVAFPLVAIVHDEIVLDVPKGSLARVKKIMNDAFQQATGMTFPGTPFAIETHQGRSWACKSISDEASDEEDN